MYFKKPNKIGFTKSKTKMDFFNRFKITSLIFLPFLIIDFNINSAMV